MNQKLLVALRGWLVPVHLLARQPGPTRSGDAPTAAMLDAVVRLAKA